ncbi:MAG: type 2 lanthipeptide synthetase LanM, partial [Acidobacteriota bacterium]
MRVPDDRWYELRLANDGLDPESFERLLAHVHALEAEGRAWPAVDFDTDFVARIDDIIEDRFHGEPLPRFGVRKDPADAPFFGFLAPMIRTALAHLRRRLPGLGDADVGGSPPADTAPAEKALPLEKKALARMVDALANRLFAICSPTLVLELNVARIRGELHGDDGPSRAAMFSQVLLAQPGRRRALFEEYSALARLVVHAVHFWVDAMAELVESFVADSELLSRSLFDGEPAGAIADVGLQLSDPHRRGRSVVVLELSTGRKLVYKPKSLAIDVRFQELLAWMEERGLEHPHYRMGVVDRGEYGWCEHVAALPCPDLDAVERFYWRQGSFLSLLYVLYGCDFHFENLIAVGETPVLIDLESLFHPALPDALDEKDTDADSRASNYLLRSVYGIGLLPLVSRRADGGQSVDLSGLSGRGGVGGFEVPVLVDRGRDTMRFEKREVSLPDKQNRPTLLGEDIDPLDYLGPFLEGFESTYGLLSEHRDDLAAHLEAFADVPIRFIPRPTARYMGFVQQTWHPDYLRRGLDQDRLFDHLWSELQWRPGLAELIPSERRDLRMGDVPFFTGTPASRDLRDSVGQIFPDFFERPSLDLVRGRIAGLGDVDLDAQKTLIKQTLLPLAFRGPTIAKPRTVRMPTRPEAEGAALYEDAARLTADRLVEQAILGDDDVNWIGAAAASSDHWEWVVSPLGPHLYDGTSGVGLFLAYAGELTGEGRYTELAERVTRGLQKFIEKPYPVQVGAFGGHSGVLLALDHLATLWRRPELVDDAAERLLPKLIDAAAEDDALDLRRGVAGAAVIALRFADRREDGRGGEARWLDL